MASQIERMGEKLRKRRGYHLPQAQLQLNYRRIYILPTRAGIALAMALIAMLLASMNYKLALGYVLVFLVAGMLFGAMLQTFINLNKLQLRKGRVQTLYQGELALFTLFASATPERSHRVIAIDEARAELEPPKDIKAGSEQSFELRIRAEQRGRLTLERLEISSVYPIGLFRAWSWVNIDMQTLVYPKPSSESHPFPSDANGPGGGDQQSEPLSSGRRRGNDDFHGLRDYQQGDSLKHVHWKALARGQGMLTKEFTGGADTALWFDADQAPANDRETRLSIACRWILDADAADLRFGLRIGNQQIEPGRGPEHKQRCLEALALA